MGRRDLRTDLIGILRSGENVALTTVDENEAVAAIFDSITPSADAVRLEACEVWKPYLTAAIPKPVRLPEPDEGVNGAEDGTRTRDPHLGKVMLYQLSHFRVRRIAPERCRL